MQYAMKETVEIKHRHYKAVIDNYYEMSRGIVRIFENHLRNISKDLRWGALQ